MPDNKKPIIRYMIIDRCIRNTARDYSLTDLMEVINEDLVYRGLEVVKSRTTIYKDITDMEVEFQAPIEKIQKGRKVCFKYSDPQYSFGNQPLNKDEIDHMKDAVLILSRFSGIPGFEWVDEVASKLEIGTFHESGDKNVISFESSEFLIGKEYVGPLFKSIIDQKVLEIKYKRFETEQEKIHLIHPYHLREYDNRWYILGYLPKHDDLITLGLERIVNIQERNDLKYIENDRFNFVDYFDDIIGIRKDKEGKEERIVLKFSPLMANYIETMPLHGSQKLIEKGKDGSMIISIEVIPNNELENKIFSYKGDVEVLEPQYFRDKLLNLYKETIAQYS